MATDKLTTEATKIRKLLEYQNSFRARFILGIVSGIGTVIGATIFAGLLIAILMRFLNRIEQIPGLENIVSQVIEIIDARR